MQHFSGGRTLPRSLSQTCLGDEVNLLLHIRPHLRPARAHMYTRQRAWDRALLPVPTCCNPNSPEDQKISCGQTLPLLTQSPAELWIDQLVAAHQGDAQLCGHDPPPRLDLDIVALADVVDVHCKQGGQKGLSCLVLLACKGVPATS